MTNSNHITSPALELDAQHARIWARLTDEERAAWNGKVARLPMPHATAMAELRWIGSKR